MSARLTKKQQAHVNWLNLAGGVVRGVQLATIVGGMALSLFSDRGATPAVLGFILAWTMQSMLPGLPPWIEALRPDDD